MLQQQMKIPSHAFLWIANQEQAWDILYVRTEAPGHLLSASGRICQTCRPDTADLACLDGKLALGTLLKWVLRWVNLPNQS